MQASRIPPDAGAANVPWYRHRWPWLLMMGPAILVAAGIHTAWLAFSRQDALVMDDYYAEGRAINLELRRDRVARDRGMAMAMEYDPTHGVLRGRVTALGQPHADKVTIRLLHSTQPQKDLLLGVRPDAQGRFAVPLPMLEIARWQVQAEGQARDWRLRGVWSWPRERSLDLKPDSRRPPSYRWRSLESDMNQPGTKTAPNRVSGDTSMLRMAHIAMVTLWPSFLAAIVAEGLLFSVVDPHGLSLWGTPAEAAPLAAYSLGFFFLWAFCALASLLTCYLMRAPDEKTGVRL